MFQLLYSLINTRYIFMFLENNCLPSYTTRSVLPTADHSTEIRVTGGGSILVLPYGLFVM